MTSTTVKSHGIFHGLPTFPSHDGKKYTAIVTGANGISGAHIVKVLAESPERWGKIYALSRRPPTSTSKTVKNIAVDFLDSKPEAIAQILKEEDVTADCVFFASYVQPPPAKGESLWSNVDELGEQNLALLSNFLSALKLASIIPKRFLLQTGAKHYGIHLGPSPTPEEEDDPRITIAPNFYFPQEDLLYKWTKDNGTHWNVTRPGLILGAVKDAAMNIVYPLAIYAAIQSHLKEPLRFPGDIDAWDSSKQQSMAHLIAYHAEWAVLTEEAKDQALNIAGGSEFSWGKFWPILAKWYGIKHETPETDPARFAVIEMPLEPPPRGFGPRGKINAAWSFEQWSQKPEVLAAWEAVKTEYGLQQSPFDDTQRIFGLLDAETLGAWPRTISMDKSRKLGWNGYVDAKDAIRETIEKLAELKMVPPLATETNGTL